MDDTTASAGPSNEGRGGAGGAPAPAPPLEPSPDLQQRTDLEASDTATRRVEVCLIDASTGDAVGGEVSCAGEPPWVATDEQGCASMPECGAYEALAPGLVGTRFVAPPHPDTIDIPVTPTRATKRIEVCATGSDGLPVAGAAVTTYGRSAVLTNTDGCAEIGIDPQHPVVRVEHALSGSWEWLLSSDPDGTWTGSRLDIVLEPPDVYEVTCTVEDTPCAPDTTVAIWPPTGDCTPHGLPGRWTCSARPGSTLYVETSQPYPQEAQAKLGGSAAVSIDLPTSDEVVCLGILQDVDDDWQPIEMVVRSREGDVVATGGVYSHKRTSEQVHWRAFATLPPELGESELTCSVGRSEFACTPIPWGSACEATVVLSDLTEP